MHLIEDVYISLLADVSNLSGIPINIGTAYEGLAWCVNDAPLLEKELLAYIEYGESFSNRWPRWLLPLRNKFVALKCARDLMLLRQLLLFCYKAEHIFNDETKNKTISSWLECNADVGRFGVQLSNAEPRLLARVRSHCTSVLSPCNWHEIVPFHGPGAVFDSKRRKGEWSRWFTTIEACYPYGEYFGLSKFSYFDYSSTSYQISDCIVARLTPVPKDSRGPRLICVHPAESIWIQQGLRVELEHAIQRNRSHRYSRIWPRGHIHFDDQTVNGKLALTASATRSYATLDLKEASDRLSDRLVQYLFGSYYRWFGCCRAQNVELPDKSQVELHSYAPMGNATTFPVQSLVFWAICVATMEDLGFHQPWDCYVFGDDIIIPSCCAEQVMLSLADFGLVVNQRKSFYRGAFRESCGVDAFNGIDVTPVRWKTTYDADHLLDLQSLSDLAQRLYEKGYVASSRVVYSAIAARLKVRRKRLALTNNPQHGGIAEYTDNYLAVRQNARMCRFGSQRVMSSILRLHTPIVSECHDWCHVLSSLTSLVRLGRSNDPSGTLSRGARLVRGWTPVV